MVIPAFSEQLEILLDSDTKFQFPQFQCTNGCIVSNYQVVQSDLSVVPVTGLDHSPTYNIETNLMEVGVDDTSSFRTINFQIRAEL